MATTLKTFNPATGELIKELEITSKQAIEEMVIKAHQAQKTWGARSLQDRASCVVKAMDEVKKNKQELADLIHLEMGKTPKEALAEVEHYSSGIDRMAQEVIDALTPTTKTVGNVTTTTYYDPLGVCASITPWNFPMGMPHTLMMPSLMAGNTVLFKPSEEVPLIGLKYAELLNKSLPQDILQVVIGAGEQGKILVEADVQLITFTGSQTTGKHILQSAGKDLKRVLLELGGKDPLIVLDDADLEAAAQFAANNSFRNTGQVCVSTEQIFVMKKQESAFLELLKKYAADIKLGSMIHKKQKEHVLKQVKEAVQEGAKLEHGNINTTTIEPMILSQLKPSMNIMVDETFGPVACVVGVDSPEEALEISNQTNYALGGVIFSKDVEKAKKLGRQMKAGMVGINKSCGGAPGSPWVGAGQSGYGFHGSANGHRQFTQLRILSEVHN